MTSVIGVLTGRRTGYYVAVHAGEKPFKCEHCGERYCDRTDLMSHTSAQHATVVAPDSASKQLTIKHEKSKADCHEEVKRTSSVKQYASALREKFLQARSDPLCCKTCGRSFKWRSNLTRHTRIHSGYKPYKCSFCGRRFTQSSTLEDHIGIHTGVRRQTCEHCDKGFDHRYGLNAHIAACHATNVTSSHVGLSKLAKHAVQVEQKSSEAKNLSGVKQHICDSCGESCATSAQLRRHVVTRHRSRFDGCGDAATPELGLMAPNREINTACKFSAAGTFVCCRFVHLAVVWLVLHFLPRLSLNDVRTCSLL